MNKPTIIFLINPKSGHKKNISEQLILSHFKDYDVTIDYRKEGRTEFIQTKLKEGVKKFVAVGGDGTINEIASVIMGSDAVLGIIPAGSGNGLARSLHIPVNINKAMDVVKSGTAFKMDVGFVNEKPFFCTAGFGFDAKCAFDYAHRKHSRGFWNYIKVVFLNYFSYKPLELQLNGKKEECFILTFANAPQFGNNAYISPLSKLNDGNIECTIIRPHTVLAGPLIGFRLMNKSIHHSRFFKGLTNQSYQLKNISQTIAHIDGEPITLESNEVNIKLEKQYLNVMIP